MTVRLTVHRAGWRAQLAQAIAARPGLIPVVKGNGYGFGPAVLMPLVTEVADTVGIGTVHEIDSVPDGLTPVVLTPARTPPDRRDAVLTVGARAHVESLTGWPGRVVVKLMSSMRRYGCTPDEVEDVVDLVADRGLELVGYSIHLPLAGSDDDRRNEVDRWLDRLPSGASLSVSHLSPAAYGALRADRPEFEWHIRSGTALWHGDKRTLELTADVLQTRRVDAHDRVGYHATEVAVRGTLAMVGAGTAHGVAARSDGGSPFHFARRPLPLVEPPHMHTSMVLVPDDGAPVPSVGDRIDLQRPLIATYIDEIDWL